MKTRIIFPLVLLVVLAPVVFAIDKGSGGQRQLRSTLTLDRRTGDIVSDEAFSDQSLGRRLRRILRFAHTSEVLGIGGSALPQTQSTPAQSDFTVQNF